MNTNASGLPFPYGDKGEIKHLTFADEKYGPEYAPLAELFDEYKMSPYIVCESDGTMSDDALAMKKMHKHPIAIL